jgi:DNA primase
MSAIPDEIVEQVRDAADLVGIIGEYVELKRTGSDYRGPCPFHGGTHRNFAVIPRKQMYYCFVCHEAGDIFTFLMKRFGMEYPAAVREIARRVGITIPERSTAGPDPREPLYSAVAAAADWYARRLREGKDAEPARTYLQGRGFDVETLGPLGLGFAPRGEDFLEAMKTLGVRPDVLRDAGLSVEREDGSVRPRFWNRLLFPIHDLRGRVVGFGGRVLGEGEPKYLNSPDSQIFHKGGLLYNLNTAKNAIRKAERAVIVEGYFDVLRLVEVGLEETIAPLGTAFTVDQAKLIKRFTHDLVLLYDSDQAGLRATFRAADVLLSAGLRVTVATVPPGQDPDTLAAAGGAEAVSAVLADAIDVLERKIQLLERKGWLGSISGRRRALDRLLPTLRAVSDPVTRDLYVARCGEALGVSRESLLQEVEGGRWHPPAASASAPRERPAPERPAPRERRGASQPEQDLLRVMLRSPRWRPLVRGQLEGIPQGDTVAWRLLAVVAQAGPKVGVGELIEAVDGEERVLLARLADEPSGDLQEDATVEAALRRIEGRAIEERLREITRSIVLADEDGKLALAREKEELSKRIRLLNPSRWNVITKGRTGSAR